MGILILLDIAECLAVPACAGHLLLDIVEGLADPACVVVIAV